MGSRRLDLQKDMRFRLLRLLEENPEMSQRELANAVGVDLGSVNYLLKTLVDKGMLKLSNFSASPDKRRYAYVPTPSGLREKAALTGCSLKRKCSEYEALRAEIEELQTELSAASDNSKQ